MNLQNRRDISDSFSSFLAAVAARASNYTSGNPDQTTTTTTKVKTFTQESFLFYDFHSDGVEATLHSHFYGALVPQNPQRFYAVPSDLKLVCNSATGNQSRYHAFMCYICGYMYGFLRYVCPALLATMALPPRHRATLHFATNRFLMLLHFE